MNRITMLFLAISSFVAGQQQMSLLDCEEAFQKNSLQLLAAQYNISEAEADIIQAKIWDLPNLSVELNAIDPENNKILHIGSTGAKEFGVDQLLTLGGKRKNEVAFAKSNKEIAELQFKGLIIDLRTQLRNTFYSIIFDEKKEVNIDLQLKYIINLLNAYESQNKKGNISLKDVVRLQSLVIGLQSDKTEVTNNIIQQKQTLKLLTGSQTEIQPIISDEELEKLFNRQPLTSVEELQQKALENNTNYLTFIKITESSQLNLKWQKSLNIPDLTVGARYTQRGAAFDNQVAVSFGIPIPLWKKNKGNEMKAEYQIEESKKDEARQKEELAAQVNSTYKIWDNQYQQYYTLQPHDFKNMDIVFTGIVSNFQRGNVSLIDFTDFMESYKQSILHIYEMKKQIMLSAEQLNQLVQTKIFY
ncbi:TolC family protein [Chryseobacterium sp. YR221]|uniref:TolC family protein n=1 Tax=Chryseobacterium sp. YR221 TaxID=1500293 RepID=UPI0009D87C11|nr:TolC family protein [Chryseobacterium sp. YR221]SMC53586.1 outer membrane protein, cobalt-zinc-cadmium efflux system [Chryseobacterium sp. YR221]